MRTISRGLFLALLIGCSASTAEDAKKIDADNLKVGQVGLPCHKGKPARVTVTRVIPAMRVMLVDYDGQQWVLRDGDQLGKVDGQAFELSGQWEVEKRHYWEQTLSWYFQPKK